MKARIQAGAQPWKGEYDRLKSSSHATRGPHGLTHINSQNNDAQVSQADASAAYTQALLWYFTNDETYAKRSTAILNSWTNLQAFTAGSDQDRLQAGWIGAVFAPAAEIMRLYTGWTSSEIGNLQAMFKWAFYPQLNRASFLNGKTGRFLILSSSPLHRFRDAETIYRYQTDPFSIWGTQSLRFGTKSSGVSRSIVTKRAGIPH